MGAWLSRAIVVLGKSAIGHEVNARFVFAHAGLLVHRG
jgi:hypothetical protein